MTDYEQFEAWWESLPLSERIIACHPVDAASHFAYKGWQAAMLCKTTIEDGGK